jgi:hypothetical protein
MKELFQNYLYHAFHAMTKFDYMALGWVLFLSLLTIVLAAFIRHRGLSHFLLFLGFTLFFMGPPALKVTLDRYIRAADVNVTEYKALHYTHALLVKGTITNRGKVDYSHCDLVVVVRHIEHNPIKAYIAKIKPSFVAIKNWDGPLPVGDTQPFRILADGFNDKNGDFNLTIIPRCYP